MKRALLFLVFTFIITTACLYAQDTTNMTGSSSSSTNPSMAMMKQEVLNNENAIMDAVKNHQTDQFSNFLADDYQGVYDMGITSKKDEVASLNGLNITSFQMTDEKVTFPTNDVAVVTYKATVQGTDNGKDITGTYNICSTWAKRDGKWVGVQHSEVKTQQQ